MKFSDGSSMRLYRQTLEDFALYTGQELSEEEYARLKTAAGQMSAKMRAVRIVAATGVSKKDLEQRLIHKGEDPDQARQAVDWMAQLNLIDDETTARQLVARCIAKGYGLSRAKQTLYEKRIPRSLWDSVLEDYPDQTEAVMAFLQSRLSGAADEKSVKRAVDALQRRGHSYAVIQRCLSRLALDTEEIGEEDC